MTPLQFLLIAHVFLVGGFGVVVMRYGVYRRNVLFVAEGAVLLTLVLINTFIFWKG